MKEDSLTVWALRGQGNQEVKAVSVSVSRAMEGAHPQGSKHLTRGLPERGYTTLSHLTTSHPLG